MWTHHRSHLCPSSALYRGSMKDVMNDTEETGWSRKTDDDDVANDDSDADSDNDDDAAMYYNNNKKRRTRSHSRFSR